MDFWIQNPYWIFGFLDSESATVRAAFRTHLASLSTSLLLYAGVTITFVRLSKRLKVGKSVVGVLELFVTFPFQLFKINGK